MQKIKKSTNVRPHKTEKSVREALSGTSIFWQYFILLAIVLVFATAAQIVGNAKYERVLTDNLLAQTEETFRKNCGVFSSGLYVTYSIPGTVEETVNYHNLRQVADGTMADGAKNLLLAGLRANLQETLSIIQFPDDTECFLYFPCVQSICTRNAIYVSATDCFTQGLRYSEMTAEQVMSELQDPGFVRIIAEQKMTVDDLEGSFLTLLVNPTGTSTVMGVIYPEQTILDYFNVTAMPDTSYFELVGDGDEVLFSYQGDNRGGSDYYEFTCPVRGVRCQAVIGVPKAYFAGLMRPTRVTGFCLLLATLLLGLVMCVVFSKVGAGPVRELLRAYAAPEGAQPHRNELKRLADILAHSERESADANQILGASVLLRVLSGGLLTESEERKLLSVCPAIAGECRIAIVHTTSEDDSIRQSDITELLQEHLPATFACGTVNDLETGILLPDDTDALRELAQVVGGVNSQLGVDGLSALCGVSAAFTGVHGAYAAVRQARFAIPVRETSALEVYSAESPDDRPGVFSWLTHERLYQAVMKNDKEDTVQFIRALAADKYSAADAKEVFYNVRFVIRSTAQELMLPLPEADLLEYKESRLPKENFGRLEELACLLFERLHSRQESSANSTMESIVRCIGENFRDPALSAPAVAARFGTSDKSVYNAVREITGQSFNDFLVSVRMREAAHLLCTTQQSVDEIAAACGYPAQSTFYRVFKKTYGDSPNRYRSLH